MSDAEQLAEQRKTLQAWAEGTLHPDLQAAVVETEGLGSWIKHPFYFGPASLPGRANESYEHKCRMAEEYLADGDIHGLLFIVYARPYRPGALLEHGDLLTDEEYWTEVANVWIDTEFPSSQWEVWDLLLHSDRPGREAMMQPEDHEVWDHFTDEPVTVWRGVGGDEHEVNTDGFSWTTHLPTAEWFARRFASDEHIGYVVEGKVLRDDVLAYFAQRSEHEVLVHPENVRVTDIREVD